MPLQHRRSSRSCIISGKCCSKYSPILVSQVGGNVNKNVCRMWLKCLCVKYLSRSTGVYKAKMYSCYTAKEDQHWRSTRACLCAFNTGGTTRRHVLKLFACLKMDHWAIGELWETFQKTHVPHRQSRLSLLYSTGGSRWAKFLSVTGCWTVGTRIHGVKSVIMQLMLDPLPLLCLLTPPLNN